MINANNVVDSLGQSGSFEIDKEQLLEWDPEILIADGGGLSLVIEDYAADLSFYNNLSAVKNEKVYLQLPYTNYYNVGMDVGHHTAYENAVSVCSGARAADELLAELEHEIEDLEYITALYGICAYLRHQGKTVQSTSLTKKLLARNSFWPCYAWLAAWNDANHVQDSLPWRKMSPALLHHQVHNLQKL